MKVKIEFTISDFDDDAWAVEYGLDKADVREDLKNHVEAVVLTDLQTRGFIKN
ncbi:hypothetical protein [Nocardia grenadensis]|uniref:hypothetical protein n=1 Tax=Nocardia grenadensis TaxID=931537 RepID=UPI003D7036CC